MNRKPRNNCSICHAEGVNSRTCTGDFESHQELAFPKIERPSIAGKNRPWRSVLSSRYSEIERRRNGIQHAVRIGVDGEDIRLKQFDETPVDTPTEQEEPSSVHEWPLTRLGRLEAKIDTILAHLGL